MNHLFSSTISTMCPLPTHNSVTVLCYHSTGIIGPRSTQLPVFWHLLMLSWKAPARIRRIILQCKEQRCHFPPCSSHAAIVSGSVGFTAWPLWQRVRAQPPSSVLWLVASAVGRGTAGLVGTGHTPSRTKFEPRQERSLPPSMSWDGEDRRHLVLTV